MAWRAISESDLLAKISGDELSALRDAALGDGQPDPVAAAIAQVTDMARGYIMSNPANAIGPAGTVPERIIGACVDILVVDIGSRVAGTILDPNDVRRTAKNNALTLLRDIAANRFAIEAASGDDAQAAAVELAHAESVTATRDTLKGL